MGMALYASPRSRIVKGKDQMESLDHKVVLVTGGGSDVARAFGRCEERFGGSDIAFLNAGIATGVDDIAKSTTPFTAASRVSTWMASCMASPLDPLFAATKLAVVGLVRSVAPLLEHHGITANTVNPNIVDTNIMTEELARRPG